MTYTIKVDKHEVVPSFLVSAFPSGYVLANKVKVFGSFKHMYLQREGADERSIRAVRTLNELHSAYGAEGLYYPPVCYGILDGIDFLNFAISTMPYEVALDHAGEVLRNRLSVVDQIKAVFMSDYYPDGRPLDQEAREVSDGEAYVYGAHLGLTYALRIVSRNLQPSGHSFLGVPGAMRMLGVFAHDARHFSEKVVPELEKKYADRPQFDDVNLLSRGWSKAHAFLLRLAENEENDTARWKEMRNTLLGSKLKRNRLIEALRSDPVMEHIFKLGFARVECRPSKSNPVFNRRVPVCLVLRHHVKELLDMHSKAGKMPAFPKSWVS